jgi:outer membrane receptor protein involved in Fe transport
LNKAFETLPGSVSLTVRGQRAMEASGTENRVEFGFTPANCPNSPAVFPCDYPVTYDLVGQIRTTTFIPGVQPSPKWTGNVITTYILGDFTGSLSARYVGGAKLDKTWGDSVDDANYQNAAGQFLNGSVDNNESKPYVNFSLNGSYDLRLSNLKQFQVFGTVNNLFDKSPPYTGGFLSGTDPQYFDTMGRAYRMGVRMKF